ncbi:MAG: HAMP domain-containing sensor histidine kinase, partial [Verrucomicrobia bacterium]|nr:HAMP domain-containing sensor histidine kinase [Verrucomicrobiota bacterium]
LWILRRMQSQSVRDEAARRVMQQGRLMTAHMAQQIASMDQKGEPVDWSELSQHVWSLHSIEDGLQYVSVTEDGVSVFVEQTRELDTQSPRPEALAVYAGALDVEMVPKRIKMGDVTVLVVSFEKTIQNSLGRECKIEVAIRKDTVTRESQVSSSAITAMFKLSMMTTVVSFAVCALLVVWLMRRENRRELQRREEEHLAFAGVLANSIVHDFRNPMSSMQLDVQMLNKEVSGDGRGRPERIGTLAARVLATLARMDKVFEEFFYLSRPQSEEMETTDIGECLNACASLLAPRFERRRVTLTTERVDGDVNVLAYPSSLRRALTNVITNAEQFSVEGGEVHVRLSRKGSYGVVDVMDRGPGIPAARKRIIFEMFETARPGGTGLGLFLAKAAVERCGGTIEVLDRPGGGAWFQMNLPLVHERN